MLKEYENKRIGLINEARNLVDAGDLDGAKSVMNKIKEMDETFENKRSMLADLNELGGSEVLDLETGTQGAKVEGDIIDMLENEVKELNKEVKGFENYIRSKGAISNDVTSSDVGVLIPEEIVYQPQKEVATVADLSQLVTKINVSTASGTYPILKRATAGMNTVEELEANPELAKPEFINVPWLIKTYRGSIAISQESIDDAVVDVNAIVAENANEQKLNTTNARIAAVLKSFTAKAATGVNDLKDINNVALDPAYNVTVVASQTFYNTLDKLVDNNGRYLLQDNFASPSGKQLFGRNVIVVGDDVLGIAGEAKAFIGDLKRAVLFANRKDLSVKWLDHSIYGEYLGLYTRFDVVKADAGAGYFVTLTVE